MRDIRTRLVFDEARKPTDRSPWQHRPHDIEVLQMEIEKTLAVRRRFAIIGAIRKRTKNFSPLR